MAKVLITDTYLNDIAGAIRGKLGVQTTYTPPQMAGAIASIPTGGAPVLQSKTAMQNGTVTPDAGYDGLSSVVVDVPLPEYIYSTSAPTSGGGSDGDTFIQYENSAQSIAVQLNISTVGSSGPMTIDISFDGNQVFSSKNTATTRKTSNWSTNNVAVSTALGTITISISVNSDKLTVMFTRTDETITKQYTMTYSNGAYYLNASDSFDISENAYSIVGLYVKKSGVWLTVGDQIDIDE